MSVSRVHLKLCIRDVFSSECSDDGQTFFCSLFNEPGERPKIYKNVRLRGLVTQKNDVSFALDDGTGSICVVLPKDNLSESPNIGDYVEVFGQLSGKIERMVSALCWQVKIDPNEEIRHLLEQAAIHRDYLQFRKLSQQTFLSSEATANNEQYEQYTQKIQSLLSKCDPDKGVAYDDINNECENNEELAKNVINYMINNYLIYEVNNYYFPM